MSNSERRKNWKMRLISVKSFKYRTHKSGLLRVKMGDRTIREVWVPYSISPNLEFFEIGSVDIVVEVPQWWIRENDLEGAIVDG